jgi:transposase-like protein
MRTEDPTAIRFKNQLLLVYTYSQDHERKRGAQEKKHSRHLNGISALFSDVYREHHERHKLFHNLVKALPSPNKT